MDPERTSPSSSFDELTADAAIPVASIAHPAQAPDAPTPAVLQPVPYYEPPPRPPAPPVMDIIAGGFSLVLALWMTSVTLGGVVAAVMHGGTIGQALAFLAGIAVCPGLPTVTLYYAAWLTLTRARRVWHHSVRTRRRVCVRCGYDVRRTADDRPQCGCDVPDSIDRTAARLERMSRGVAPTPTQPGDGAADLP